MTLHAVAPYDLFTMLGVTGHAHYPTGLKPKSSERDRYPYNQRTIEGTVTVRVPRVLLHCKVVAGAAVTLMVVGTVIGSPETRAWSLLLGVLAAGICIRAAVQEASENVQNYIQRWAHCSFEDGFKGGVEQGRAMEAAERFIASTNRD